MQQSTPAPVNLAPNPSPRRWLRRAAWTFGALALLLAAGVAFALVQAERTRTRTVDVAVRAIALPDVPSPEVLARGRHLYLSRGCADCHGADGAGRLFVDEPGGPRIGGPQLAPGARSVVAAYGPADWDRAVRHGVAPTGRPLMVMPSEDYAGLSDEDFVALVAHLKALPPVDGRPAVVELPVPARIAYGLGAMKDAAAKIDHALPPSPPVAPGVTTDYGRYVAMSCLGCHGPKLEGGRIPGGPPDWPPAPRIVAGGDSAMARYPDAASLAKLFATGRRPDGSVVRVMPFEALGQLDEVEVAALHRYLSGTGG